MTRRSLAAASLVLATACGGPSPADRSGAGAPAPEVAEHPEAASEDQAALARDPQGMRERRRSKRLAHGEVVVARFEGEFAGGGLPEEPTRAIPIGGIDLRFVLVVRVTEVLEGEIPGGWTDHVTFAVHSPSILFRGQGLEVAANRHVPEGRFVMTLWALPRGGYDLALEPRE
jgi:hypothetical protein